MTAWKTQTDIREMRTVLTISKDLEMVRSWESLFRTKNCYLINEITPYNALQTARLLLPSLIIFNLELEQSEHISLCQELRKITMNPILLLSEWDANIPKYYQGSIDEYLIAPVNPLLLVVRSMTWLVKQEYARVRNGPAWAYA